MAETDPASADKNKPVDSVDALAAMASGADLNEADPYAQQTAELEGTAPAASSGAPADAPAVDFGAMPVSAPVSKVAAAKKLQKQTSAVYAQQYKRILTPMLLCIGGLLILIGIFCFVASGKQTDTDNEPLANPPLLAENFKYFGLIAGPMGLILLVGSYLFHMELARKGQPKAKDKDAT